MTFALDPTQSRLACVDILRALAAIAVLVYHARAEFWIGMRATLDAPSVSLDTVVIILLWPFSLGWLGVPIFFVLSGYCIHLGAARRLARGKELRFRFLPYMWRRFVRIYPVFLVALLLTALLSWLQSGMPMAQYVGENAWAFLVNLLMLQELAAPAFGFNTVMWTLSIEMHLYAFYPVTLWIVLRWGPVAALGAGAAISIATAVAYVVFNLNSVFVHAHGGSPLFLSHLLIWVAGAYLAEVHSGRARLPVGPAWHLAWLASLILGIALQLRGQWGVSPLFLAVGALGLVEVIFRGVKKYSFDSTLAGVTLERIGLMSYSLYATHRITFEALVYTGLADRHASVGPAIGYSFLAIGSSALFFVTIERATIYRTEHG